MVTSGTFIIIGMYYKYVKQIMKLLTILLAYGTFTSVVQQLWSSFKPLFYIFQKYKNGFETDIPYFRD